MSTDLSGRGLDVEEIRFIVNFDLPKSKEQFLHWVGRGGRFGRKGVAISLVLNIEKWKI